MKSIGGYFGLDSRNERHFHDKALRLNSAHNAFELLLSNKKYRRIYMPAYCCRSLLHSLERTNTEFVVYHVDRNFVPKSSLPELQDDWAILYVNYFGLKDTYIKELYKKYAGHLIIDNSQAFFSKPIAINVPTFYSPRKWFGVADGAYLYATNFDISRLPIDLSFDRMQHLLIRIDESPEAAFELYRKNEELLSKEPVRKMSRLTESILRNIDYAQASIKRRTNFFTLHDSLAHLNLYSIEMDDSTIPMAYPLLMDNESLRKKLIDNRIYCAKYWLETVAKLDEEEEFLRNNLLSLPIDQRYDTQDMKYILKIIKSCM